MVSSTAPRLEARCPPLAETTATSSSLISAANCLSFCCGSDLRPAGLSILSSNLGIISPLNGGINLNHTSKLDRPCQGNPHLSSVRHQKLDAQVSICYTAKVSPLEQELLRLTETIYTLVHWPGVVALMAIESACIPLPSEIIMPLAGWMLVKERSLSITYILVAGAYGALGCCIGSIVAYAFGVWGGRPFLEKYGKYILISHHDLVLADRWFAKSGSWAIFLSRLLPIVRTFISLPAGIARMNLVKFLIYTFIGSFIWCTGLAYGGYQLGEHWEQIRVVMRPFDPLVGILIIFLIAFFIYRHLKHTRQETK